MSAAKPRAPTIIDVAERAQVSISTVSRVLNGNVPVQADKAERVRAVMNELHFVPRLAARGLASRKTHTLGLMMTEIRGAFFPHLLRGIEATTRAAGYQLLIHTVSENETERPTLLGEHNTDGLLVFTSSLSLDDLRRLSATGFPLVLMHQTPPEDLDIPVVTIENKDGAAALVSHLITHGRRRIAFLRGPAGHEDSVWRERGYREALAAHKLPVDERLIATGDFDEGTAYAAIMGLLAAGLDFDAVFAGDDDGAVGVFRALKEAGLTIPDQVAVVGFDDVRFSGYIAPALTTVRAPIEQVGCEAVRQLLRRIQGEPTQPLTLLPTEMVIRESCGCGRRAAPSPQRRGPAPKRARTRRAAPRR